MGITHHIPRREVVPEIHVRREDEFYIEISPFNDAGGWPVIILSTVNEERQASMHICGPFAAHLAKSLRDHYFVDAEANARADKADSPAASGRTVGGTDDASDVDSANVGAPTSNVKS